MPDAASPTLRGFYRLPSRVSAAEDVETAPDLCEMFTMSRLGEPGVAVSAGLGDAVGVWGAPNVWPDEPPELRAVWLAYYAAMEELAAELMRLFAIGLGLDERHFDDTLDEHITNLTANHYPAVDVTPAADQYRKGPHSDWGSLTILYQDGTGGLEVVDRRRGGWVDVPVLPRRVRRQHRRPDGPLDQRTVALDEAPGASAPARATDRAPRVDPVLPPPQLERGDRVPAGVHVGHRAAGVPTGHGG